MFVAGGDVNRDGSADIIVGTDTGSSQVKVFDGITQDAITTFTAFDPGFLGGVFIAGV